MFLILSVKSAAESVISVQGMRNINKSNKGDHTRNCEFKKKKKIKMKSWSSVHENERKESWIFYQNCIWSAYLNVFVMPYIHKEQT